MKTSDYKLNELETPNKLKVWLVSIETARDNKCVRAPQEFNILLAGDRLRPCINVTEKMCIRFPKCFICRTRVFFLITIKGLEMHLHNFIQSKIGNYIRIAKIQSSYNCLEKYKLEVYMDVERIFLWIFFVKEIYMYI